MLHDAQGELTYGKVGEWRFDKRSYLQGPIPRNLPLPPPGVPESVVCPPLWLISLSSAPYLEELLYLISSMKCILYLHCFLLLIVFFPRSLIRVSMYICIFLSCTEPEKKITTFLKYKYKCL